MRGGGHESHVHITGHRGQGPWAKGQAQAILGPQRPRREAARRRDGSFRPLQSAIRSPQPAAVRATRLPQRSGKEENVPLAVRVSCAKRGRACKRPSTLLTALIVGSTVSFQHSTSPDLTNRVLDGRQPALKITLKRDLTPICPDERPDDREPTVRHEGPETSDQTDIPPVQRQPTVLHAETPRKPPRRT